MRKTNWYTFLNWPKVERERFPFVLTNSKNEATLYEAHEEKKYLTAQKKQRAELIKKGEINE